MTGPTYSIRNWNEFYENSRSRTVKDLSWVPVPNKHDGETFAGIMAAENGAEIYSAWILILQVASKCNPRGKLVKDNGTPHDARSLSVKTRAPEKWFSVALQYLAKETDWLSCEGDGTLSGSRQAPITIPSGSCQLSAEERREGNGIEEKENTPPQTPPAKPRRPMDSTPEFLSFWNVYPRKVGKPNAARAFAKALRGATAEDIMRGLAVHLPAWAETDPQFTPHPATWLNRQGWNDSPLPKTLPKPTGNYSKTGYRQPQARPVVTETDRFVRQQIEDGILRVTADGKIEAVPIEELSKTKP